jgi:probable rRNA maturation factor
MAMLNVDVFIEEQAWAGFTSDWEGYAQQVLCATLTNAMLADLLTVMHPVEIGVRLTNDGHQRILNHQYRGKDQPTNVLSFPLVSAAEIDQVNRGLIGANEPDLLLGDIILAYETIVREAEEQDKQPLHHITHLLVHGCLHLLGYDHEGAEEAEVMECLEKKILTTLSIANPYANSQ